MQLHYGQSSRENAAPSSGTFPLASYKEVPPRGISQNIYITIISSPMLLIHFSSYFGK